MKFTLYSVKFQSLYLFAWGQREKKWYNEHLAAQGLYSLEFRNIWGNLIDATKGKNLRIMLLIWDSTGDFMQKAADP